MTETTPIGLVVEVRQVPAPENRTPYFLFAYWASGGWWKVIPQLYEFADSAILLRDIEELTRKGWTHIRVCKLPE